MAAIQDFDDVFPHIGGFGPYQYILFTIICFFNFLFTFLYYGQIFMTLTPPHWCAPDPRLREQIADAFGFNLTEDQLKDLTIPKTGGEIVEYSKCSIYEFAIEEVRSENGSLIGNSSWATTTCLHGWTYNFTLYYPTITSQLNWVCSEDWKPAFAQTCFFVGSTIGVPFFGWMADRFGRIPTLLSSSFVGGVFGIASSFCSAFVPFCVLRFIVGLAHDSNFYIIFILGLEYVSASYRSIVANVPIMLFLTSSMCSLPWIAYAIHNWTWLGVFLHAPFFIPVVLPCITPESARWLISNGKVEKATNIVKKAARINGKKLSPEFLADFKEFAEESSKQSSENISVMDLLKTPNMRKRVLALAFMWISIVLAYDGHVRHTENIGSNIFVSFTLMGVVEFPGDLLTIFLMEWFGRRHTTTWSLIFSGIAAMGIIFVRKSETYLLLGLAIVGRFLITMAINVGQQYIVEVLPTVGRAQGSAAIHTAGLGMAFASPYIVYLSKFHHWLPYVIFGAISVVGGVICFLLPETLGEKLPDSLKDGEEFFADQPCCYNPCSRKTGETGEILEKYTLRRTSIISRTGVMSSTSL